MCGVAVFIIENTQPTLLFQPYIHVETPGWTLLFSSNGKSAPQVQEVLDDSPFFVREDGVSIMNGANEGVCGEYPQFLRTFTLQEPDRFKG